MKNTREAQPVIEIMNLNKTFGKNIAVNNVSLSITEGAMFGFLGPNGAGKTTTIRCVMNFLYPTSGEVKIFGKDVATHGEEIRKDIGYFGGPQQLYQKWTAQEHIDFVHALRGKGRERALKLAAELELNINMPVHKLSSGNKQKCGIILALMHEPRLIILDEPTNALDPLLQHKIYDVLHDARANGATVFLSSHNLAEVERICDEVAIIKDGTLIAQETMEHLREKHLYTVALTFQNEADYATFIQTNTEEVIEQNSKHVVVRTKRAAQKIITDLSSLQLRDVEIRRASLEDIFLEYYR